MSKKKFGFSTLIGLILGVGFIVGAVVASGHTSYFWNLPSFFITIGGTTASIVIAYPPKKLKTFLPVIKSAFVKDDADHQKDLETMMGVARLARAEGLLSLEGIATTIEDKFLQEALMLMADGVPEEDLRNRLEGVIYFTKQRHNKGIGMMNMVAATAPSLGLLGTYVGLIPMLHSLDDPSALGPMMALELVSSFYGAFIAYVLFSPLAKRLRTMSQEEADRNELFIEGLMGIAQGKNPRMLESDLIAFMNLKYDEGKSGKSKNSGRREKKTGGRRKK